MQERIVMQTIYETERLFLKILGPSDAEAVVDYYQRNRSFLEEFEPARGSEFYTAAYQAELLEKDTAEMANGAMFRLWLLKKDGGKLIGSVAFNNIVRGAFLSCFVGYRLDEGEINRGYMTEALRKGIEIMFREFGLHRMEANIMPGNRRSLRVVEKLGFCNEGLARRYLKINGKWEDHIHMVLLNNAV